VSFVNTLKQEELNLLRNIVKKEHFKCFDQKHGKMFVTNYMLDQLIDSIGPEIAERIIKQGTDAGLR